MGISEKKGYLVLGVLIIRMLLFRLLCEGPLFSETTIWDAHSEELSVGVRLPATCSMLFHRI